MFVFEVEKSKLKVTTKEILVAGSRNSYLCCFGFSPDWEGLDRTAVFLTRKASRSCILGPDNRCLIPWEVLEKEAEALYISVYGTRNGEEIRITAREDLGEIRLGAVPGEVSQEPTPEVYDQLLAAASQAVEAVHALRQEADTGEFDGADGLTPYIRDGNWWIGTEDTGVQAEASMPDMTQFLQEMESLIAAESAQAVSDHNTAAAAHNDIRLLIQGLTSRLNALADSDDTTLDQMAEVAAYIKSNRDLIEQVTTGKVSVADIVDNLTTNANNKPLSARQGAVLKTLIDSLEAAGHSHANQAELDLIQSGSVSAWNNAQSGALADAKTWVNQQGFYQGTIEEITAAVVAALPVYHGEVV